MNLREKIKYMENFQPPFCSNASKYEKVAKIGQGAFGAVFKARDIGDPTKFVAMKKVLTGNETEGFPITALRELRILQKLNHVNIITLIEICVGKDPAGKSSTYLVLEFCEHDLAGLLANANVKFLLGEIKNVLQQLFNGLYFLHNSNILHRDLKTANVLINKLGVLKLADFGLARPISDKKGAPKKYTNRVVTLWYRPPELLLGERNYGTPIDLWGAGCIMAEMWTRSPIMQGSTEQQQLALISQLCGSITPQNWPGVENLELYNKMQLPRDQRRKVLDRLKPYMKDPHALDLFGKLLVLDPSKRCNADDALNHYFFWTDPMPCDLVKMLENHSQSMFEFLVPPKQAEQVNKPSNIPKPTTSTAQDDEYKERIF